VLPWFLVGRIVRPSSFNSGAAGLYDRFAVPVGAFVERLVPPPVGKNLLSIAKKRG
jgi:hypothetical protein